MNNVSMDFYAHLSDSKRYYWYTCKKYVYRFKASAKVRLHHYLESKKALGCPEWDMPYRDFLAEAVEQDLKNFAARLDELEAIATRKHVHRHSDEERVWRRPSAHLYTISEVSAEDEVRAESGKDF